jgi:hypothetical protein
MAVEMKFDVVPPKTTVTLTDDEAAYVAKAMRWLRKMPSGACSYGEFHLPDELPVLFDGEQLGLLRQGELGWEYVK